MNRFWALIGARNKEFYRDRSALGWAFLFPVLVVCGFGFAFRGGSEDLFKVGIHGTRPESIEFFKTPSIQFVPLTELEPALGKLRRHQYDMVVSTDGGSRYWLNTQSPKGQLAEKILKGTSPADSFTRETVQGEEIRYVDWLISGLLALNMSFSALYGVGYAIVRYRKNGVLKRLKATPLHAFEFLSAQMVSRLLLIVTVTSLVYAICHGIVRFRMQGSYLDLFAVLVSGAVCLISLGLLLSARVKSEELAEGLLNLLAWSMMFASGVWFSLEGAHPAMQAASQALPLTQVIAGARAIMTEGASLSDISVHLAALWGMAAVFLGLGSWAFKWE